MPLITWEKESERMPKKHRCSKCRHVQCRCEKKKCAKCGHRRCLCENKNAAKQNVVQKVILNINVVAGGTGGTGGTGSGIAPFTFEFDTSNLPDGDGDIDFRTGSKK
jgi:hypothetical protein